MFRRTRIHTIVYILWFSGLVLLQFRNMSPVCCWLFLVCRLLYYSLIALETNKHIHFITQIKMSFLASFAFLLLFFYSKVSFIFISFLLTFGFLVSIIYDIYIYFFFLLFSACISKSLIMGLVFRNVFSVFFFYFYVYYTGDKCSQRIIINSMFGQCKWRERVFFLFGKK